MKNDHKSTFLVKITVQKIDIALTFLVNLLALKADRMKINEKKSIDLTPNNSQKLEDKVMQFKLNILND